MSLIPIVSKLFERNMYDQIMSYINKFFSPYLFGYRKGYSTAQCLTVMLEVSKRALDGKGTARAILTDLSKAFDCLNHNLLIGKMFAYSFDKKYLKVHTHLLERKKTKNKSKWLI